MDRTPHPLSRKLAIVLVIKLVVLTGLWWGFVRDERVPVDTDRVAARLLGPLQTPPSPEE
jgi:hypothetical protein